MAARNLVVENFDQLNDSALNELGNDYQRGEWPSGPASSISLTEVKHGCVRSKLDGRPSR